MERKVKRAEYNTLTTPNIANTVCWAVTLHKTVDGYQTTWHHIRNMYRSYHQSQQQINKPAIRPHF
jgi:hypothetical protein